MTLVRTVLVWDRRAWSSLQPLHVATAETSVTPGPLPFPLRFAAGWCWGKLGARQGWGRRARSAPWTAPQEVIGALRPRQGPSQLRGAARLEP